MCIALVMILNTFSKFYNTLLEYVEHITASILIFLIVSAIMVPTYMLMSPKAEGDSAGGATYRFVSIGVLIGSIVLGVVLLVAYLRAWGKCTKKNEQISISGQDRRQQFLRRKWQKPQTGETFGDPKSWDNNNSFDSSLSCPQEIRELLEDAKTMESGQSIQVLAEASKQIMTRCLQPQEKTLESREARQKRRQSLSAFSERSGSVESRKTSSILKPPRQSTITIIGGHYTGESSAVSEPDRSLTLNLTKSDRHITITTPTTQAAKAKEAAEAAQRAEIENDDVLPSQIQLKTRVAHTKSDPTGHKSDPTGHSGHHTALDKRKRLSSQRNVKHDEPPRQNLRRIIDRVDPNDTLPEVPVRKIIDRVSPDKSLSSLPLTTHPRNAQTAYGALEIGSPEDEHVSLRRYISKVRAALVPRAEGPPLNINHGSSRTTFPHGGQYIVPQEPMPIRTVVQKGQWPPSRAMDEKVYQEKKVLNEKGTGGVPRRNSYITRVLYGENSFEEPAQQQPSTSDIWSQRVQIESEPPNHHSGHLPTQAPPHFTLTDTQDQPSFDDSTASSTHDPRPTRSHQPLTIDAASSMHRSRSMNLPGGTGLGYLHQANHEQQSNPLHLLHSSSHFQPRRIRDLREHSQSVTSDETSASTTQDEPSTTQDEPDPESHLTVANRPSSRYRSPFLCNTQASMESALLDNQSSLSCESLISRTDEAQAEPISSGDRGVSPVSGREHKSVATVH